MFLQTVAKVSLSNSGWRVPNNAQHGKISIYTASILAVQRFRIAILNGYSHA